MLPRMPFYKDPIFLQKAQNMGSYNPASGGPFSATRNAVANSLMTNRNAMLGNTLGIAGADAGRNQAMFNNNLAWQTWQGETNRRANEIKGQETMAYQARMEEARRKAAKKSGIRSMVGQGLGMLGGAAGTLFGGPIGGMAGQQVGSQAGKLF